MGSKKPTPPPGDRRENIPTSPPPPRLDGVPMQEPRRTDIDKMLDRMTSDVLKPLVKMNDRGTTVCIKQVEWQEIRKHVKRQLAEVYFGTHKRIEEMEAAKR